MGDFLALAVVALILGLAIYKIRKNKQNNTCGCGCQGCGHKDQCGK